MKAGSREEFAALLRGLEHAFWDTHWNVAGQALARKVALVGSQRVNDMVLNVLLPAQEPDKAWDMLARVKTTVSSTKEVRAREWLVGREHAAACPTSALWQQGLLQLHDDFLPANPRTVFQSLKHAF